MIEDLETKINTLQDMSEEGSDGYFRLMTTVYMLEHLLRTNDAETVADHVFMHNETITKQSVEEMIKDTLLVQKLSEEIEDDSVFYREPIVEKSLQTLFGVALSLITLNNEEAMVILDGMDIH